MTVLQNLPGKIKGNDRSPPSRHQPWPSRLPVNGPLFDARFRRHISHLCDLGVRPVGECFLQLVGTGAADRTGLIMLLEQYARLSPESVKAIGADVFPPAIFAVDPT